MYFYKKNPKYYFCWLNYLNIFKEFRQEIFLHFDKIFKLKRLVIKNDMNVYQVYWFKRLGTN